MEVKFNAPANKVFGLLTNAKWLEERSLALGELSAKCPVKKSATGLNITMKRRVHRDLPAIIAKVLNPDSDIEILENWTGGDGQWTGTYALSIIGKPITVTANFELKASGKGCVYSIDHVAKVKVPLIGGVIEKFVLGETQKGCADELEYLSAHLKTSK